MTLKSKFKFFIVGLVGFLCSSTFLFYHYRSAWIDLLEVVQVVHRIERIAVDLRAAVIENAPNPKLQGIFQQLPELTRRMRTKHLSLEEEDTLINIELSFLRLIRVMNKSLHGEVLSKPLMLQIDNEMVKVSRAISQLESLARARIGNNQIVTERIFLLIIAGSVIVCLVGFLFVKRYVVSPILALRNQVEKVKEGELENINSQQKNDEIGVLHGFIFSTIANLKAQADKIRENQVSLEANLRREMKVMEREARYRAVIDDQTELICRFRTNGSLSFVNEAFCSYFACKTDEIFGRNFKELMLVEDRAILTDNLAALSNAEPSRSVDLRLHPSGKEVCWVRWTVRAIFDSAELLVEYQAVGNDITEMKRAQEYLVENSKFLRTVIDCLKHPFYVIDANDYTVKLANKAAGFGLLEGASTCYSLTHDRSAPCDSLEHPCSIEQIKRTKRQAVMEHIHYDQNGQARNFEIHAHPIYNKEGQLSQVIEYSLDITERKKAEQALIEAKKAAEKANHAKGEFLANTSHEIRTPMNGILGMTNLALEMEMPDNLRSHLQLVKVSAERLLTVLNDILDFSKIEANMLELEQVGLSLRDTVDEATRTLTYQAEERGIELECFVKDELPDALIGDPVRLQQVLINLVGNGIKFTKEGGVYVTVEPVYVAEKEVKVRFVIRDTGEGISKGKKAKIFNAFCQGDSSVSRRHGGTGLGLAISSQLAELMGGKLWLDNNVDQGSIFYFTARFHRDLDERKSVSLKRAGRQVLAVRDDVRLLLAEDDFVNRTLAEQIVRQRGWRITSVENGQQALDILEKETFDLILMDIQMPELDGLAATRLIRAREEKTGQHVPVVAMTAHAVKGYRQKCISYGMDDYITKPLLPDAFFSVVEKWLPKKEQ